MKHAARGSLQIQDAKIRHMSTIAQLSWAISSQLMHASTIRKKGVKQQYLPTCPHIMANFGPLTAEIGSGVWGTPANFNGFRVLAALPQRRHFMSTSCVLLLHGSPAAGINQTSRRGTRNGIKELPQRAPPIFGRATMTLGIAPHSSSIFFLRLISAVADWMSTILSHVVWP